jgi:hypothetical protein
MANAIPHKRGDTFSIECAYTDSKGKALSLSGMTVRAQVRNASDKLVGGLEFIPVDLANGKYRLQNNKTEKWTLGCLVFDIEYILADGRKTSTDTVTIDCIKDETR